MSKAEQTVDLERIVEIAEAHRGEPGSLIPVLQAVQGELGYIPKEGIEPIAYSLGLFPSQVQGVLSFYSQFYSEPRGKHTVCICRGTACHVRGARSILKVTRELLGVDEGETTEDLRFSLETVACLGACSMAPSMLIDSSYYGRLAPPRVASILGMYRGAPERGASGDQGEARDGR